MDNFVEENNIEVGFLEGAVNTIKTQKPILMISIYHSYDDFFNIKPLIESWNLSYKFKIFKPIQPSITSETMLLAEPIFY